MILLVTTPIGNFNDITLNALETLRKADCILCEDTRKTDVLLKHYGISGKRLLIYNEYTSEKDLAYFLFLARENSVCIVSDAGTPLICDPGHTIIRKARQNGIAVGVVPGVCSLIAGATLCGVNIQNMLFLGFFSSKNTIKNLQEGITYSYFVAPHDILSFLGFLQGFIDYDVHINIAKDLTKEYEQALEFDLAEAIDYFQKTPPKGEFVFFIKFEYNGMPKIDDILSGLLSDLTGWNAISKKDFAKFLHLHPMLRVFTAKDIYNALLRLDIKSC